MTHKTPTYEQDDEQEFRDSPFDEARRNPLPPPSPPNSHDEEKRPKAFEGISAATLKGKQKPREFLDHAQIFPIRNVALLMGDGAVGKSLTAIQLALACTTGSQWIGMDVNQGRVIYFSAEDDRDEITNRLNEICDADEIDLGTAYGLTVLPMAGEEEALLCVEDRGRIRATPAFYRLRSTIEDIDPVLVILDNLADVYGGDENSRTQAKQFITLLRGLCIQFDTTIVVLGHPSLSGMASGSGTSGSTAWNNSVRVRLYLTRSKEDDADDDRVLEVMKANYSKPQARFELKWANGRFVRSAATSALDRIGMDVLDKVKLKFASENWRVDERSDNWGGFAVADILGWDVGRYAKAKVDRTKDQNNNRRDVITYLAMCLRSGSIHVVQGRNAKRELKDYYSDKPPSVD